MADKSPTGTKQSNVAKSCVLVEFNIKQYSGVAKAKQSNAEFADSIGADKDWTSISAHRLDAKVKKAIQSIVSEARNHYKLSTLPWFEGSARLCKATEIPALMAELAQRELTFEDSVNVLVKNDYETHKANALERLGEKLFNEIGFPSLDEILGAYSWKVTVHQVPNVEDLYLKSLGGNKKAHNAVKTAINEGQAKKLRAAVSDLNVRLKKVVDKAVEVLSDKDKGFHDTLIGNIQSVVEALPALNITEDPELARIAKNAADSICKFDPKTIKSDEKTRQEACDAARSISEDLAAIAL